MCVPPCHALPPHPPLTPTPQPTARPQLGKEILGALLLAFNVGVCAYFIWCYIREYVIGFIWLIDDESDDLTADGKLEWKDVHGFAAKKFEGSRFLPAIQRTLRGLERCSTRCDGRGTRTHAQGLFPLLHVLRACVYGRHGHGSAGWAGFLRGLPSIHSSIPTRAVSNMQR